MKSLFAAVLLITVGVIVSTATAEERACRPSLSNFYHCPDKSVPASRNESVPATKPTKTSDEARAPAKRSTYSSNRASEGSLGAHQYATEAQARFRCPSGTVVWVNTHSNVYHFQGARYYGNTKAGVYMCEQDSINQGMRAAKNETHP